MKGHEGSPYTATSAEERLQEVRDAAAAVAGQGGPDAADTVAMLERITSDPSVLHVLEAEDRGDSRPWWIERGSIVLGSPVPPSQLVPASEASGGSEDDLSTFEPDDPTTEHAATAGDTPSSQETHEVPSGPRGRLPSPLSRFIGRTRELQSLTSLLREQRLVTVTGSGGSGKTRLVQEFARSLPLSQEFCLVDLAPVADDALVSQEVAAALGRQEGGIGSYTASMQQAAVPFVERLAEALRDRELLLILDHCDRVSDACADLIKTLLETCPGLRVLATSRVILDLDGEAIYRLPSLSLPPRGAPLDVSELLGCEAIQLFLDRARAKRPDLDPTSEELAVIADVCRGVDGMPYAIELAAARVRVLSMQQILERLDEQLSWLAGRRHRPARQQAMRTMIDWSHQLLSDDEQTLLRRLAVFQGGFSLGAAEDVCAFSGLSRKGILGLLRGLEDKSLVETEEVGDGIRYRLLEVTRQYAYQRCMAAGEDDAVRAQHRQWCLRLAEAAAPRLVTADQEHWLEVLERESENMRAALEPHEIEGATERLRLAAALSQFWFVRGHLSEGRMYLERVLKENIDPSTMRAMVLSVSAELALTEGRLDDAARDAREALPVARRYGNRRAESFALRVLGVEAHRRRPGANARDLLLQSRALAEHIERPSAVGFNDVYLGNVAETLGDYPSARRYYREAERWMRQAQHVWGLGWALRSLGAFEAHQNSFDDADRHLREALELARRVNSRQLIVSALLSLGTSAFRRDDQETAALRYQEAMQAMESLDDRTTLCLCRASMAKVAVARSDLGAARRWLDTVDAHDPLLRRPARAKILRSQGWYLAAVGDAVKAEQVHQKALHLWQQLGDRRRMIEELESLAFLAAQCDQQERAGQLLTVTSTVRTGLRLLPPPIYRDEIESLWAVLEPGTQDGVKRDLLSSTEAAAMECLLSEVPNV